MIDSLFISDLHLDANHPEISHRFLEFLAFAKNNAKNLYILGDFFNLWAGDDLATLYDVDLLKAMALAQSDGLKIFMMPGNRDFLMGEAFLKDFGIELISDPFLLLTPSLRILLAHGDSYCKNDTAHQRFRRLTQSKNFKILFLRLPKIIRHRLALWVRTKSQKMASNRPWEGAPIDEKTIIAELEHYHAEVLIQGHIHKPGFKRMNTGSKTYYHCVLSDWDHPPKFLAFDVEQGLSFMRLVDRYEIEKLDKVL